MGERFARSIRQKCAKTSSKLIVSQGLRKAFRERFGSPQKPQKNPKPGGVGTQRYSAQPSATQRTSAQPSATQRTSSVHQVDATINLGIHVIRSALSILTFCSRRPNHMREAEDLHPTPTPALTPTRAIAKPIGSAPGTPQKATFSAWLPGRVNRTPGALREPPKRPKRSQNASPRPPKNLQKNPKPGRENVQRRAPK